MGNASHDEEMMKEEEERRKGSSIDGRRNALGRASTPLLLPLSPQRTSKKNRPHSSPTQRTRKSVYGTTADSRRRHTYGTSREQYNHSASTNNLVLGPGMR